MLRNKIAQIQDQQQLLLQPSPRVEEISEQWLDQMQTSAGVNFDISNSQQQISALQSTDSSHNERENAENAENAQNAQNRGTEELGFFGTAQKPSWMSTIGEELTTTFANSSDLYDQMQNFDGSFDAFQPFDAVDPVLSDHDIMQRAIFSL